MPPTDPLLAAWCKVLRKECPTLWGRARDIPRAGFWQELQKSPHSTSPTTLSATWTTTYLGLRLTALLHAKDQETSQAAAQVMVLLYLGVVRMRFKLATLTPACRRAYNALFAWSTHRPSLDIHPSSTLLADLRSSWSKDPPLTNLMEDLLQMSWAVDLQDPRHNYAETLALGVRYLTMRAPPEKRARMEPYLRERLHHSYRTLPYFPELPHDQPDQPRDRASKVGGRQAPPSSRSEAAKPA